MTTSFTPTSSPPELGPQPLPAIPTVQVMRTWNEHVLLQWIKQEKPDLLGPYLDKFIAAGLSGETFLRRAGNIDFFKKADLSLGVSELLANLGKKVKKRGKFIPRTVKGKLSDQTAGKKRTGDETDRPGPSISPKRNRQEEKSLLDSRKEAGQSLNQKRLQLSLLPGSDAIYETESAVNRSRLFFPANAEFSNFFNEPSAIIVDKTHFIPLLEQTPFEYMFLRPRRWGKSTFLNMLAAYYDVKTKDSFEEIFGGLHIGKAPTKFRNSHIILLFNFSTITAFGSPEKIEQSVFDSISRSLHKCLLKYRDILNDALPEEYIIPGRIGASLSKVLDLIHRSGYTAFVGVDEYDAPANTCLTAALRDRERLPQSKHILDQLETLLKSEFFAVIKDSCGSSVAKYWLTGVLPAFRDGISPLTATRVISFNERYHSLCGLTQENVNAIVKRALPESKQAHTLDSLKRWYNGYMFSFTSSGSENLTLYNPRLVFDHLQAAISNEISSSHIDEANATHTATVLSVVGETGPVAINDLINMLYSKVNARILRELSFVELMREQEMRPRDVTWSLLYYLGIVTFCENPGMQSLRVPNGTMVHLINRHIKEHLSGDPGFSVRMRNSYKDFMRGNTTPFVKLLEDFFRQRSTRSLADTNEPVLRITIELLWFGEAQFLTEMHLVMDPAKRCGDGRDGFVDVLVSNSQRQHDILNPILVMELKNVSLLYLWKARQQNPTANPTSQDDYEPLLNELGQATEDQLLDLKYSFFDKKGNGYVTQRVKDTLQAATTQLNRYINITSGGQGVLCIDGGRDVLQGYVIICVAGTRVVCRQTATRATQCSYETFPAGLNDAFPSVEGRTEG